MSRTTNIILVAGTGSHEVFKERLAEVNRFFTDPDGHGGDPLRNVNVPYADRRDKHEYLRVGSQPYGGSGFWSGGMAWGAINRLPIQTFIDHLQGVAWDPREDRWVQLMYLDEPAAHRPYVVVDIYKAPVTP